MSNPLKKPSPIIKGTAKDANNWILLSQLPDLDKLNLTAFINRFPAIDYYGIRHG